MKICEVVEKVTINNFYTVPRYWYHSLRGRGLDADGNIQAYPLSKHERELGREFKGPEEVTEIVWIAPKPLSRDAFKIDITKLNDRDILLTGQAEGYAVHRGAIPKEAIVGRVNG